MVLCVIGRCVVLCVQVLWVVGGILMFFFVVVVGASACALGDRKVCVEVV